VGKALGHKTLTMTQRYAHLAADSHKAAFEAVAKKGSECLIQSDNKSRINHVTIPKLD
jgi:hypothetical protein